MIRYVFLQHMARLDIVVEPTISSSLEVVDLPPEEVPFEI
jgi:hypothetical protein